MDITIKELADELGVSKPTVSKAIDALGIQDELRKVGNRFLLSDTQSEMVKMQITQNSEMPITKKTQEETKSKPLISQNETEKSLISLLETQITILQEQLTVKDGQIAAQQEQIRTLTESLHDTTAALTAAQALHAGTIKQQLTDKSVCSGDDVTDEPQEQKQGFWQKLFRRK